MSDPAVEGVARWAAPSAISTAPQKQVPRYVLFELIVALLSIAAGVHNTANDLIHVGRADFGLFQKDVTDLTKSLLPETLEQHGDRFLRADPAEPYPLCARDRGHDQRQQVSFKILHEITVQSSAIH